MFLHTMRVCTVLSFPFHLHPPHPKKRWGEIKPTQSPAFSRETGGVDRRLSQICLGFKCRQFILCRLSNYPLLWFYRLKIFIPSSFSTFVLLVCLHTSKRKGICFGTVRKVFKKYDVHPTKIYRGTDCFEPERSLSQLC